TLSICAAQAQNTGGIFPPMVNEGHKSVQYRGTYNTDSEGFAQRVHYQQALNGDFMWRVMAQARKTDDSDVDLDFMQAELFWEISDDSDKWKTGLRFDARVRTEGRPGLVGLHWTNQFPIAGTVKGRFVVLSATDIGDDRRDGVFLQTRGNVFIPLEAGPVIGLEYFSSHGSTEAFGSFKNQSHQLGPFANFKLTDDWGLFTGALLGVSEAAADQELRIWLTRNF
ncbi:MAG: hypothetical protein AAGB16_05000, partial [Pseudomonadota bacterium]